MNLLRAIFGERRKSNEPTDLDRRKKNAYRRWKESGDRLDRAVESLEQTVSMKRGDFMAMIQRDQARQQMREVVIFSTYSEICEYRYAPGESLMRLCKHPGHPCADTGIAACREDVCPRLKEAAK